MTKQRNEEGMPVVFTPDNEPYLGRNLLFHFDRIISSGQLLRCVDCL